MPHPLSFEMLNSKVCPRCQKRKAPTAFYPGKNVYCKPCMREYTAEWRRANPDEVKEFRRRERQRHKSKLREKENARKRRRNAKSGGAYWTARRAKRRAAKAQRLPAWADRAAIRAIYEARPPGHHVDHIIPLRGETVSGLHVAANLQYLPATENLAKSNSF